MQLRTLSNVGEPLINPDGSPLVKTTVSFTLVDTVKKIPCAAWSDTGQRVSGVVSAVTDASGEFSVNLVPNDQLQPATVYLCESYGIDNRFYAVLESGVDVKKWRDFFLTPLP